MFERRPYKARATWVRSGAIVLMVLGVCQPARAESTKGYRLPSFRDVEATASVTLDRLSVGALRADRPWNPRVCVGCDLNNGSAFARLGARRPR